MELAELYEHERVALVALLDKVIAADRSLSDEEVPKLREVIEAMGEDAYNQAVERAGDRFDEEADLGAFLETITRQEARELIYATAEEVAMANAITQQEAPLLDWLRTVWRIEERTLPPR